MTSLPAVTAEASPTPAVLLPRRWIDSVLPAELPGLAREIIRRIRAEIPEYRRAMDGPYGRSIRSSVERALVGFMTQVFRNGELSADNEQFFRDLGRGEALEGRPIDVLQGALRTGTLAAWQRILRACEREPLPAETVGALAESIFGFADRLARLASEGYSAAQGDDRDATARQRARLARMIVGQPDVPIDAIAEAAAQLCWPVPERIAVLDGVETAVGLPGEALVDREQRIAVLPAPVVLDPAPPGRLALGCSLPFAAAAQSLRWARLAARLREQGVFPDEAVTVCDERIPDLLVHAEPAVVALLVERRLRPLGELPPVRRLKFARLLSAWLENGGSQAELAGTLATHRQTLHYRIGRLQAMFGAQLQDPDARVEMLLALRAVLPEWERAA